MNASEPSPADQIHVLVFKENFASRSFRISLAWLSKLGIIAGILVAISLVSIFLAAKYYIASHHADPVHLKELELELADLRSRPMTAPAAPAPAESLGGVPSVASTHPTPTVTVTVTSAPASEPAAPAVSPVLFSALPQGTVFIKDPSRLPISIDTPKVQWSGKTLHVRFSIQFIGQGKGPQTGRIIVLARGSETLVGHPTGIFKKAGSDTLVSPSEGEYFSVSRFRAVDAEFGPFGSREEIQEIELLLFNSEDQVLIHQIIPAASQKSSATVPAAPAAPAKTPVENAGAEPHPGATQ